jgi:hypothetical protein
MPKTDAREIRDTTIRDLAELIAGLAVPVSMQMPLGKAGPAWSALHSRLVVFGWATADQYEEALRKVLDA